MYNSYVQYMSRKIMCYYIFIDKARAGNDKGGVRLWNDNNFIVGKSFFERFLIRFPSRRF